MRQSPPLSLCAHITLFTNSFGIGLEETLINVLICEEQSLLLMKQEEELSSWIYNSVLSGLYDPLFSVLGICQGNLLKLMFCNLVIWYKTSSTKYYITMLKLILKEENTVHVN